MSPPIRKYKNQAHNEISLNTNQNGLNLETLTITSPRKMENK